MLAADDDVNDMCYAAPLTYEHCSVAGKVNICEKEDEYTRGELQWCPVYPMYRQLSQPQGPSAPPVGPAQVNVDEV